MRREVRSLRLRVGLIKRTTEGVACQLRHMEVFADVYFCKPTYFRGGRRIRL